MTYAQLRRQLAEIAAHGDDVPDDLCRPGRWRTLIGAGCIVRLGGSWILTELAREILRESKMSARRPEGRPIHHSHRMRLA